MFEANATATPDGIGAVQAAPCGVGSTLWTERGTIRSQYRAVRSTTSAIATSLSAEDQMVQSCPDASPVKWHQAHTTWFFETFVLRPFLENYKPLREEFHWLFNSYYNSLGEEIPTKSLRSVFSRPSLDEVLDFRLHVDQGMDRLLTSGGRRRSCAPRRVGSES